MGSTSGEEDMTKKRAMWLYPKVMGFKPSERWGHSTCCSDGVVYVFGGCCGGLHFSDVLMLDLKKMVWSSLSTSGQRPGTRDSHGAVLVGQRMIVLGGTNGSKKVNDLHILNLRTKEWSRPHCNGNPPSPRESHTVTVVGDNKLVIFGGSGEGEGNYLNDVHILDLDTMTWTSPEVKGDLPVPRDSHTAVAIGNQLFVYGGDSGDRYHGEVDVLDVDTLTWSRLVVHGSSPGVRAGHAAMNIGTKVYIVGGVGDKRYYNDVWVLDVSACSWSQLDIRGQQPQGRFSHTAIVTDSDIAIFGGCGEDERPLKELLILQLGALHPNDRYNISMCKTFGNQWNQERHKFLRVTENLNGLSRKKSVVLPNGELNQGAHEADQELKLSLLNDNVHQKRRKTSETKTWNNGLDQEEQSLSPSQHSSPSQSDQEQNNAHKLPSPTNVTCRHHSPFKFHHQTIDRQPNNISCNHIEHKNHLQKTPHDLHPLHCESPGQPKTEQFLPVVQHGRLGMRFLAADEKPQLRAAAPDLIGAGVHGTVDTVFDSGYLMTANVNGQIFRGVLFAPGPGFVVPRPTAICSQSPAIVPPVGVMQTSSGLTRLIPVQLRPLQEPRASPLPVSGHHVLPAQPAAAAKTSAPKHGCDLQGLVLTLGGSGGGNYST